MQPLAMLRQTLKNLANTEHYLFSVTDLSGLFPQYSAAALHNLIKRAEQVQVLQRVCRGIYLYPDANPNDGLLLYHTAARLRASDFNYISLETALSDVGIISQIPLNWITLMSSGRSHIVNCGKFGNIEFTHTKRQATDLVNELSFDQRCGLWRASVALALQDMRYTRRSLDLVDPELANEFI